MEFGMACYLALPELLTNMPGPSFLQGSPKTINMKMLYELLLKKSIHLE